MNNEIVDYLKIENFDINIINIINNYVNNIEEYEKYFFNDIIYDLNKDFLSLYFNIDLNELFSNDSISFKISYLNNHNLEIYDIENELGIELKQNKEKKYFFKWLLLKDHNYENILKTDIINQFKQKLIKTNKTKFSLIDIYNICIDNNICFHCVIVDISNSEYINNDFFKELKKIFY